MQQWRLKSQNKQRKTLSQLERTQAESGYCVGDEIDSAPASQIPNHPDNCGETRVAMKTCLKQNQWVNLAARQNNNNNKHRWQQTRIFPRDSQRRRLDHLIYFLTSNFVRESDVSWWRPLLLSAHSISWLWGHRLVSCCRGGVSAVPPSRRHALLMNGYTLAACRSSNKVAPSKLQICVPLSLLL